MNLSRCVVTFTDSDRIVHEVEVWASTVYEAVGEAMREFRAGGITNDLPGLNTELPIAVHRQLVTHNETVNSLVARRLVERLSEYASIDQNQIAA